MASLARAGAFNIVLALSLVLAFGERPRSQPDVQAYALQAGFAEEQPIEVPFGPKGEDSGRLSRTGRMMMEPVSNVQAGNVDGDHPDWLFMSEDHATKLAADRQKPIADSNGRVSIDVRTGGKFVAMRPQEPASLVDRASTEVKEDPSLEYKSTNDYATNVLTAEVEGIKAAHPGLEGRGGAAEKLGKAYGEALDHLNKEGLDKLWKASHELRGTLEWRHDEHLKEVESIIQQTKYERAPPTIPDYAVVQTEGAGLSGLKEMDAHVRQKPEFGLGPEDVFKVGATEQKDEVNLAAGGDGGATSNTVNKGGQDNNQGVPLGQSVLLDLDKTATQLDDTPLPKLDDPVKVDANDGQPARILFTLNSEKNEEKIYFAPNSDILEQKSKDYLKGNFRAKVDKALASDANKWLAVCVQASTAFAAETSGKDVWFFTTGDDPTLKKLKEAKGSVDSKQMAAEHAERLGVASWAVNFGSKKVYELLNQRRKVLQGTLKDSVFGTTLSNKNPIYWANKDTDMGTGLYDTFPGGCVAVIPCDSAEAAKAVVCSEKTFEATAGEKDKINLSDPATKLMTAQGQKALTDGGR